MARSAQPSRTARAAAAAALLLAAAPAVAAPVLQRCTFGDGQVRTLMVDPGAFPLSLARCEAVAAPPEATAPAAAAVPPAPAAVTLIESPAFALASAGAGRAEGPSLPLAGKLASLVHAASERYRLDVDLLHAIIRVESGGNPSARSPAGALGLMQVMPGTGARYGVRDPGELLQPAVNIDVGARYLSDLRRMFGDRLDLVVAAYNAGEGAVMRHGMSVPPFAETREYVRRVLGMLPGGAADAP